MTEEPNDPAAVDESKRKGAAVLALIGAGLAVVGALTTWVTVNVGVFSAEKSGVDWTGDAKWLIVIAVIAGATALTELTGWQIIPWLKRSLIVDGIIMGALAGSGAYDATRSASSTVAGQTFTAQQNIGAGLWMSLFGAAIVLVAGVTLAGGITGVWNARSRVGAYGLMMIDPRPPRPEKAQSRQESEPPPD